MKILRSLYFWILIAFVSGCIIGLINPSLGLLLEPLGTNFIKLIKIFIPPVVFLTVASGIAQSGSLKKLSKIGLKAFIYFEIISSIALLIGWACATLIKPGSAMQVNIELLNNSSIKPVLENTQHLSVVQFLQNIIPSSLIEPFMKGDMMQILFIAILFGISLLFIEENGRKRLIGMMEPLIQGFFQIIRLIMYAAPFGVLGAIAANVAKFGGQFLLPLMGLLGTFYLTALLFVLVILGLVAKLSGFSLILFLKYLAPELLLVLGTSSSESALLQLMKKLENLGCQEETVGVVVPMGYSFNLDGTNIYITLSALFIAQAFGIQLTFMQQLALFATAMLSSKGAAGITGAGFITLAATLSVLPVIPIQGIVLILGIDRFMSEGRSLINFIGNGVASLAISRWENEMSAEALQQKLERIDDSI